MSARSLRPCRNTNRRDLHVPPPANSAGHRRIRNFITPQHYLRNAGTLPPAGSSESGVIKSRRRHTRLLLKTHPFWERNTLMMLDWNEYQKEIGSRLAEFMKATPDSVRGYQMLSNANSKTTHLGEKTRRARKLPPRTI